MARTSKSSAMAQPIGTPAVQAPAINAQPSAEELTQFRAWQSRNASEAKRAALENALGISEVRVGPHPDFPKDVVQYLITLNVPATAQLAGKSKTPKSPNRDLPVFTNERATAYVAHDGIPCSVRVDMYGTRAEDAAKRTGVATIGKSVRQSDGTYLVTYNEGELARLAAWGITPNG